MLTSSCKVKHKDCYIRLLRCSIGTLFITHLTENKSSLCSLTYHIVLSDYYYYIQPSTAILNQLSDQLVSIQISWNHAQGYKFNIALTVPSIQMYYIVRVTVHTTSYGLHCWSRAYIYNPTAPDHECIHVYTQFSLHAKVPLQHTANNSDIKWKPY